jgi:glycosyltransferase involved in cell wall biosynthesis
MKLCFSVPESAARTSGNRVTAARYARIARALGLSVVREPSRADVLVALHARKGARALLDFAQRFPDRPRILVLTGTDVYPRLDRSRAAQRALELATRIIALEPGARMALPPRWRKKCVVIQQSVPRQPLARRVLPGRVLQLAHLRSAKDPLLVARASRGLSGLQVRHWGAALSSAWARRAQREMQRSTHYHWFGECSAARAWRELSRAWLFVLPSRVEGSSRALAEALVMGVPILASDAAGNVGTLGRSYPGLFAVGDARALRRLLQRCLSDASWFERLRRAGKVRARQHSYDRELAAWRQLLAPWRATSRNKKTPRGHRGREGQA